MTIDDAPPVLVSTIACSVGSPTRVAMMAGLGAMPRFDVTPVHASATFTVGVIGSLLAYRDAAETSRSAAAGAATSRRGSARHRPRPFERRRPDQPEASRQRHRRGRAGV